MGMFNECHICGDTLICLEHGMSSLWSNIEQDGLPQDREDDQDYTIAVLVTDGQHIFEACYGKNENGWYSPIPLNPPSQENLIPIVPTHWMLKIGLPQC